MTKRGIFGWGIVAVTMAMAAAPFTARADADLQSVIDLFTYKENGKPWPLLPADYTPPGCEVFMPVHKIDTVDVPQNAAAPAVEVEVRREEIDMSFLLMEGDVTFNGQKFTNEIRIAPQGAGARRLEATTFGFRKGGWFESDTFSLTRFTAIFGADTKVKYMELYISEKADEDGALWEGKIAKSCGDENYGNTVVLPR